MTLPHRRVWALLFLVAAVGCDSVELTIGVTPGASGSLEIANADDRVWPDARLLVEVVESDGSMSPCAERTVASWQPGETVSVPQCSEKVRLTLTTGQETARFSFVNGQLNRYFGRKEVPVAQ